MVAGCRSHSGKERTRKEKGKKTEEFISGGVMFAFQDIREKLA
jgi:hypothetical protein